MSEEAPAPDDAAPAAEVEHDYRKWEPTTEKKRKVGFKTKMALLEVIERKRLSERVDYKAICARHGIPNGSLRRTYSQYSRGLVDLGDPTTPEEKQIDARMQHEKALELLKRYKAIILNGFEAGILHAEDAMTNGDREAWKKVSPVLRELKAVAEIQSLHERGYNSILEEMMANRQREEKHLMNSSVPISVQTQIIHANDEERALAAMAADEH